VIGVSSPYVSEICYTRCNGAVTFDSLKIAFR
jgi:hypothetical protein